MTMSGGFFMLLAAQAIAGHSPAATTQAARPTGERLKDYASALTEIQRVREAIRAQAATFTPAQRDALQHEANERIAMILRRYDFDRVRFNAVTAAVESRPDIRQQVHQAMMDRALGT